MKFVSKEAQNSNIVAVSLNSSQHPGRVSVTLYRHRDFVQMASKELLDPPTSTVMAVLEPYYFEPNMLQTPKW